MEDEVGSITVLSFSKVTPFGSERVQLCSAFGCTSTYVGAMVHTIAGAVGVGRYQFKKR
jgi:hypothetical protein